MQSAIRLFADICLIYRCIKSIDDHRILQEDLNMLMAAKFCIIQRSHACCKSRFTYSMRGLPITEVENHP